MPPPKPFVLANLTSSGQMLTDNANLIYRELQKDENEHYSLIYIIKKALTKGGKTGYYAGTPWDPLLGRVQDLKGLWGLPWFPALGSSPRGLVAQKWPQGQAQGARRANFGFVLDRRHL